MTTIKKHQCEEFIISIFPQEKIKVYYQPENEDPGSGIKVAGEWKHYYWHLSTKPARIYMIRCSDNRRFKMTRIQRNPDMGILPDYQFVWLKEVR